MSKYPTTPSIPPQALPPSLHSSSEPVPEHPPVNMTTAPNLDQSVSIEGDNTPYLDSSYPNDSPTPQLSPLVTPSLLPLSLSSDGSPKLAPVHPPAIPTTTMTFVSIEGGNTQYPPIATPFIPPLPNSPAKLAPVHPPAIPTTTMASVSIEGGNTQYPPIAKPFIPPLPNSPDSSPEPAPKQPSVNITTAPDRNQSVPMKGGDTPFSDSAYSNNPSTLPPPSSMETPSVFIEPSPLPPQIQPELNRHRLSEDFTGYSQYLAAASQHQPPMPALPNTIPRPSSPYYRHSVPFGHQNLGTPWSSNAGQLPSTPWPAPQWAAPLPPSTPWPPPRQLPPPGFSPAFGGYGLPDVGAGYPRFYGSPYLSPWIAQPSQFDRPPYSSKLPDHMDPFMEGKGYGAVLDPFLIKVLKVDVQLNPLITPLLEAGSDRVHLIWNMLFPTSMIQRSTDPPHISWSEGRDAPATFPRISSLSIVSDAIPWVLNVEAKDNGIGVTCGEVIDSIGYELGKFSYKRDHTRLTPSLRSEVGEAYYRNRSPDFGVPGGQLGQGMKRLDFLCQNTMFAGIEIDDLIVKRVCGEVLPCVFVLKCSKALPVAKQGAGDRKSKLKTYKTASSRLRSRAKSQLNKLWYIFRALPRQAP